MMDQRDFLRLSETMVREAETKERAKELYEIGLMEMGVQPLEAALEAHDYVEGLPNMDHVYGFIYYTGGYHDVNEPRAAEVTLAKKV